MENHTEKIYRIELPVPLPVKTVNAYLIDEEPLTLVDPGIKTKESYQVLEFSLRNRGCQIRDIRRILLTHGHIDHYGQAKMISDASGADICIHKKDYERIRSIREFGTSLVSALIQNGTPRDSLDEAMTYMEFAITRFADPLDNVRFITDGEEISFENMGIRCIHCPGHSPGLICFYVEEQSILISGDHLLDEISPNPIIDLSHEGPGPQSTSLKQYIESIRKIQDLNVSLVLPGHGVPIHDFKGAVEKTLHHHEQRLSMVLSILSQGEMTAYEISKTVFPGTESFEVFLGVSEIVGHLRILVDEGKVVYRSEGGIDYYATVQPA
jgi:glyoxylase-like metal-dependent hydrolase (beta-lactamase superfamily II)